MSRACTQSGVMSRRLLVLLTLVLVIGACLFTEPAWAQTQKTNPPAAADTAKTATAAPAASRKRPGKQFNWKLWGGIGGGAVVVLLLVLVAANQKSKNKGPVDTGASGVIGGYRLQNLMMTGQSSQVW